MTNDTVKPEVGKGQPKEKNEKKTIKMCASYFREIFDEYKRAVFQLYCAREQVQHNI
jgi:hypothetical protein